MNNEEEFYQDTNYNEYLNNENNSTDSYKEINEDIENENLINMSIELLIQIQNYCQEEAIPIGEKLSSIDLYDIIKYGYIL